MGDRQRDDWGQMFRSAVASGRAGAHGVLIVAFGAVVWTTGIAQAFGVVVGLVALVAAFPKSPLIPAIVQWLPKLPTKGSP